MSYEDWGGGQRTQSSPTDLLTSLCLDSQLKGGKRSLRSSPRQWGLLHPSAVWFEKPSHSSHLQENPALGCTRYTPAASATQSIGGPALTSSLNIPTLLKVHGKSHLWPPLTRLKLHGKIKLVTLSMRSFWQELCLCMKIKQFYLPEVTLSRRTWTLRPEENVQQMSEEKTKERVGRDSQRGHRLWNLPRGKHGLPECLNTSTVHQRQGWQQAPTSPNTLRLSSQCEISVDPR